MAVPTIHIIVRPDYASLDRMESLCKLGGKSFYISENPDGLYRTKIVGGYFGGWVREDGPAGTPDINLATCKKCIKIKLRDCKYQDSHTIDPWCDGCGAKSEVLDKFKKGKKP
jgi:hypothetical protein